MPRIQRTVRKKSRRLEEKHFRRVKVFNGKSANWREWAFQVRVALKAADGDAHKALEWTEKQVANIESEDVVREHGEEIKQVTGELFDVLCMRTEGKH